MDFVLQELVTLLPTTRAALREFRTRDSGGSECGFGELICREANGCKRTEQWGQWRKLVTVADVEAAAAARAAPPAPVDWWAEANVPKPVLTRTSGLQWADWALANPYRHVGRNVLLCGSGADSAEAEVVRASMRAEKEAKAIAQNAVASTANRDELDVDGTPATAVTARKATQTPVPPTAVLTLRFGDMSSGMEEVVHSKSREIGPDESMPFQMESATWSWESMGFRLPCCFTAEASLVTEGGGSVCAPRAISLPADDRITWSVWRSLPESAAAHGAALYVDMQFTRVAPDEYVLSAVAAQAPDRLCGAHAPVRAYGVRWWESEVHRSKVVGSFAEHVQQGMKGAASWARWLAR
jgi:hypothetical protein